MMKMLARQNMCSLLMFISVGRLVAGCGGRRCCVMDVAFRRVLRQLGDLGY